MGEDRERGWRGQREKVARGEGGGDEGRGDEG